MCSYLQKDQVGIESIQSRVQIWSEGGTGGTGGTGHRGRNSPLCQNQSGCEEIQTWYQEELVAFV